MNEKNYAEMPPKQLAAEFPQGWESDYFYEIRLRLIAAHFADQAATAKMRARK
jgi:hypothetical protein